MNKIIKSKLICGIENSSGARITKKQKTVFEAGMKQLNPNTDIVFCYETPQLILNVKK